MKFIVTDTNYQTQKLWTSEELLEEVNRDRSEGWTDYNEQDLQEDWEDVCSWISDYFYVRKL